MARRESEAGGERDSRDAHARERFMRESVGGDGAGECGLFGVDG